MYANRQLGENQNALTRSMERLSSGMRINRAGDDASGLAVSEKMRSQVRGLQQAWRNTQDGVSYIQTTEGALNEVHSILHRMRELAIQSASGIYSPTDRSMIQVEVSQLTQEVEKIAMQTEFNSLKPLNGTNVSVKLHIGANQDQNLTMRVGTMTTAALGIDKLSISTPEMSNAALTRVDKAVELVSKQRADLGAIQNRLEHTMVNLGVAAENAQAAESRIRDTDMAGQMVDYTKQLILMRSGMAMLAQANVTPQSVLQILG
jgi:flagellin